jgi:cytochrome c-type biogenesis protein CcmF
MVVHLGVIMIAVALSASNSFSHTATLSLTAGEPVSFGGHTFELLGVTETTTARGEVTAAEVSIDGGQAYAPKITLYTLLGQPVPTPSVKTGLTNDIYLALENRGTNQAATEATIRVFIKPLVIWMWIGGGVMALGTVLAAFPGSRRRKPTDPVSAPVPTASEAELTNA